MKVSIIIPIYNVENEIIRCIRSVIDQDYPDIEIVLVNDATIDNSFVIAKKYLESRSIPKEQIVCVEHEFNQGLSVARNSGIDFSSGDYLFFLDSDDALSSEKVISHLIRCVEKKKTAIDVVVGSFRRINENESLEENIVFEENYYDNNAAVYRAYVNKGLAVMACMKLVRRSFLIENSLYFEPNIYHEDQLWAFHLYRKAASVQVISLIIYDYYYREGSITVNVSYKNARDLVTVALKAYETYMLNRNYFPIETVRMIETFRRLALKSVILFTDKSFISFEIERLKYIRLSIFLFRKSSLIRNYILLKMPTSFIVKYLFFKYK